MLVCFKCTRWKQFQAETEVLAKLKAKKKGWKIDGSRFVCAKCPG